MNTVDKMALNYDIEQLYIDGFSPTRIAKILEIDLGIVFDWLYEYQLAEHEFDPFATVNS
jgi:hypothetical protein